LKGNNDRSWQATFDCLVKDENMAKVLNGNFDNRKNKNKSCSYDIDEVEPLLLGKEPPPTAADDPNIKARAEALQQQFAKTS